MDLDRTRLSLGDHGILRLARRPPGWRAPGPRPPELAAAERPMIEPGEDLCYLAGDWRIFQRQKGHRWSLDDLVTAWFAAESMCGLSPRRFADLGCGVGSVLMLIAWRFPKARGVGIEAQAASVELARRSLRLNGADRRCEVRMDDLRDPGALPEEGAYDLVTGTPPYFRRGTATESARLQCGPCRSEHRGGIEAYCEAAARLLSAQARFVVCHPAGEPRRAESAAGSAGLAIERRRPVVPREGKPPLFSVLVMRRQTLLGSADPFDEEPLVVRDAKGARTPDFLRLRAAMGMPP